MAVKLNRNNDPLVRRLIGFGVRNLGRKYDPSLPEARSFRLGTQYEVNLSPRGETLLQRLSESDWNDQDALEELTELYSLAEAVTWGVYEKGEMSGVSPVRALLAGFQPEDRRPGGR